MAGLRHHSKQIKNRKNMNIARFCPVELVDLCQIWRPEWGIYNGSTAFHLQAPRSWAVPFLSGQSQLWYIKYAILFNSDLYMLGPASLTVWVFFFFALPLSCAHSQTSLSWNDSSYQGSIANMGKVLQTHSFKIKFLFFYYCRSRRPCSVMLARVQKIA